MTRSKAIEQMCKECIYDPCQQGTWRQQTEACVSAQCPLFKYRPRARKIDARTDQSRGRSEKSDLGDQNPLQEHSELENVLPLAVTERSPSPR